MKKLAFMGGALGVGISLAALLTAQRTTHAADHLDAPGTKANAMADINDVYAWTDAAGGKVNLVMTVSPGDPGTRHFGPSVQYVFHVTSKAGLGVAMATGTETKIICTFASDTSVQCWVGDKDYVTGDPSATTGITSASGKVKVFAGRRSDPFFFNLQGFRDAVKAVETQGSAYTPNVAGCPALPPAVAGAVAGILQEAISATPALPCTGSAGDTDCFKKLDVQAIVLQVDKTLLNAGTNTVLSVWASTHTAP